MNVESYMIEIPVEDDVTADEAGHAILESLDLDSFEINGIGLGDDPDALCLTFYGTPDKMYYLLINYVIHE